VKAAVVKVVVEQLKQEHEQAFLGDEQFEPKKVLRLPDFLKWVSLEGEQEPKQQQHGWWIH
jgi:hypothetical protein